MINAEFESCDESEFPSLEAASRNAINSGARVVADAIAGGDNVAAVELQLHEAEQLVAHHVVSLSVADLFPRS